MRKDALVFAALCFGAGVLTGSDYPLLAVISGMGCAFGIVGAFHD